MKLTRKKYLLIFFSFVLVFIILTISFSYNKKNIAFKTKNGQDIIVDNIHEHQKIKSPLLIRGKARGNWFFEGEFTVEIYDSNNNFLGKTILRAQDNWMTTDFVSFEGELYFKKPETKFGELVFLSANPSGLSEFQKNYSILIEFENVQYKKVFLYYYNPEKDKDEKGSIKCSEDGLVAIEKEIPLSYTPIQDTISLLLKGKENLTIEDYKKGIETEFPLLGFELKSVNLKPDGTLILEFNDRYSKTSGGSCRIKILWLQIEKTAKQFQQVKKIEFKPEYLFQP